MTRIRVAIVLATVLATAGGATALATHGGFHSSLLADGTWSRGERTEFVSALAAQGALASSRVVTVSVTVDPVSSIDWHGHSGPSVVVVTSGTIEVTERAPSGRCETVPYNAGAAFFHSADDPHRFTNPNATASTFVVTYFVPTGGIVLPEAPGC
jgi:quercetin dioxygenase-like cupin family protein